MGLAELGHNVTGFDPNREVVENLEKGVLPLEEPGLSDLLKKNLKAGRLKFSTDFSEVDSCNVVWITFDTPVNDEDEADISVILKTVEDILSFLPDGVLIILSSQLSVGTSGHIKEMIKKGRPSLNFDLAYVPENLQLGRALQSFFEPERIVIGAENEKVFSNIESILALPNTIFLRMNLASAEVAKHALNAFLATSLTFIYDIADLCEKVGADVVEVARALRLDPRIGPSAYLDASIGFSGGTLGRDLQALLKRAKEESVELPVIASVLAKNKSRRDLVIKVLERGLGDLEGKTVGILGLTYKAGTPTLRRSLALEIAGKLKEAGVIVRASDPQARREEVRNKGIVFFADPYEMARGCEALILVTAWPQFGEIDPAKLRELLEDPKIFFDTRNFLKGKEKEFKDAGIKYIGIGRG